MADLGLLSGLAGGIERGLGSYLGTKQSLDQQALQRRAQQYDEILKQAQIRDILGDDQANQVLAQINPQQQQAPAQDSDGLLADMSNKSAAGLLAPPAQQLSRTSVGKHQREMLNEATKATFQKDPSGKILMANPQSGLYEIQERELTPKEQYERSKEGLGLTQSKLDIEKKIKELNAEKKGKTLPSTEAQSTGSANAAVTALDDVADLVKSKTGIFGPGAGRISGLLAKAQLGETGREAASVNATLKQRAQIIGKYLEGGKLTDSDIKRYEQSLPQLSDSPQVAQDKIDSLQRLIAQKQAAELKTFKEAGYDVGGVTGSTIKSLPGLKASNKAPPPGLSFDEFKVWKAKNGR